MNLNGLQDIDVAELDGLIVIGVKDADAVPTHLHKVVLVLVKLFVSCVELG